MILCKQIVSKINEAYFSAHASTLINLGRIRVKSGYDPDYYPGQRVIRVSDGDPVSTLVAMIHSHSINASLVCLTHKGSGDSQ